LLKIANQITKRSENALGDKDIALKDRFVEGILDKHLKREVKRCNLEHKHKSMSFLNIDEKC
jgi:hypothetical protein